MNLEAHAPYSGGSTTLSADSVGHDQQGPVVHIHASVGDAQARTHSGHLSEGAVRRIAQNRHVVDFKLRRGRGFRTFRTVVDWDFLFGTCTKGEQQMNDHEPSRAIGQSEVEPRTRVRADAKITVRSSEAKPYDQTASPALINGDPSKRNAHRRSRRHWFGSLEIQRDDQSACLVSLQRFRGKLGGRQGTFVLQGSATVENGKIKATWFVAPGSGTGDLSGLRGAGSFEGHFGKGSDGTLDYWFE